MSCHAGPNASEENLVLCLDATNPRSYPGTGNAWYDLSGNGNNGTLVPRIRGYTFNNSYFTFPSSTTPNEYAYVSSPIPTGGISWTVECMFRASNINGERHIFRTPGNFGCDLTPTNRLRFYMTEYNVEQAFTDVNTFFPNQWTFLTMTYDRDAKVQAVYKNGIFLSSKSHSIQYNIGSSTNQWFARSDLWVDGLDGDASLLRFYNRALSQTEIQQNFNATRGRFGI